MGLGLGLAVPTILADVLARSANAATLRTRYNASSSDGKRMLKLYAEAVAKMRDAQLTSERSPRAWIFQWYTHEVPTTTSKGAELVRVFGPGPSPEKDLASEMWGTCMAHKGRPSENFMPWHRAYVLYFEEIVRRLSSDEFTLPYWDYTTNAAIPIEFRQENDLLFRSLFIVERNNGVNAGTPIDKVGQADLNLEALLESDFLPGSFGVPQGFSRKLDKELHGRVHVSTGNRFNMGDVPFAARDPIFWLHHSNIDRIWEAWNAYGGVNPGTASWKNQKFVFANADGSRVEVTNGQMVDAAALGYQYDSLPSKPSLLNVAAAESPSVRNAPANVLASTQAEIILNPKSTMVALQPVTQTAAATLSVRPANPQVRRFLVISNISSNAQPGVLYHLYARAGETTVENPTTGIFVGSIHFFDAVLSMGHDMAGMQSDNTPEFVFDITDLAAKAAKSDSLTYFIVPAGRPHDDASPIIGKMRIIEK